MFRDQTLVWSPKMHRLKSSVFVVLLFTVFVGLVSPFAVGESSKGSLFRRPRSLVAESVAGISEKPKSRVRKFLGSLNPSPGRKDGRWKGGESTATVPSRLLFSYIAPLLELASQRTITEEDAFRVSEKRMMEKSVESLTETYGKFQKKAKGKIEKARANGSEKVKNSQSLVLLKALVYNQRRLLITTGILRLLNTTIQAFPALLVSRLLRCVEAGETYPVQKAINLALLLVSVLSLKMIIENQFFHNVVNMSTQTRGAIEGLIFDKSLRLPGGGSGVMARKKSDQEKKALGSGGVLNLMQSDASTIESAAMQIHTTWDGLLQIALYSTLLYKTLGRSIFWGIAVLLSAIPLNSITLRLLDSITQRENEAKDARTRRTTESINNMQLLKVQAWEDLFAEDIRRHRRDELSRHKSRGMIRSFNSAISNCVPSLVLVVTLTAYAKTGNPIVASTIFTAISLFNQLRFPLFFYPMLIDSLANGKNSLRRISSYLTSEELTPYVDKYPPSSGGSIEMDNGNFLWPSSDVPRDGRISSPDSPALCNVKLSVKPGEVVAVVGSVGSGKSALVQAILGELAPVPRMVVDSSGSLETGELIDKPSVKTHGNVAYCSQDAWIPKGTVREAVVFGREFDESRYLAALYDAGLDKDIANGVFTHDTDVGEGGSSLSGGQRARVALARALYSGEDTKVFLLDDCLAALDASVGSLVFERIKKRLKSSNSATLLVTNDPSIPRRCDRVVLMGPTNGNGSGSSCSTIVDVGTYDELLSRGHKLTSISAATERIDEEVSRASTNSSLNGAKSQDGSLEMEIDAIRVVGGYKVHSNTTDLSCHPDCDHQGVDMQNNPDLIADRATHVDSEGEGITSEFYTVKRDFTESCDSPNEEKSSTSVSKRSKLVSADDKMSTKAVPFSTYVGYFKAVRSPKLILAMAMAFIATNGAQFFQQLTVAKWTELAHSNAMAAALGSKYLRSLVYAAGAVSVFLWLRSYFTMLVGLRASDFYHDRMVSSVFRAPMSFFYATPSGQVLSRFGKEMETIDRALPESYASVMFCALQISSSVLALAGAVTPIMMLPIIVAGNFYYKTMKRFRRAARDMKRSETKTRSPIFTHFSEALRGTATIRSIPGASGTWSSSHRRLSDTNLSVFGTVKALDRWLSTRLEALGNFMVLSTALASIFLCRTGRLLPGKAGWGLTQSLAITGLMAWAVRNLTMLESHMMSVMRVRELTDIDGEKDIKDDNGVGKASMPKEFTGAGEALRAQFSKDVDMNVSVAPLTEAALIADGWPWKGGIRFKNVSMRYNPSSPMVLRDLSVDIPPGSTLGVVGRTGSGKSSLLLTLFRIVEIEKGGSIEIDGVDIRSVGLKTLREKMSIIPQDPVLFVGTIGYNLDATRKTSPEDMWAALEAASPELAQQFRSAGGLETPITEGGGNLSQGQRQLICLARALLRKNKVLVLDEATSSVDSRTDQQVQDTIRTQFVEKGVTVITVAHRLDTVMGYDKIAVLGSGNLLEYGRPSDLRKIPNGELKRLVDADRRNKQKGAKIPIETAAL